MRKLTLVLLAFGLVATGAACTAPTTTQKGGVTSSPGNNEHKSAADVAVTSCSHSDGFATIKVTITNQTSKRSNYILTANILDASGAKVGEAFGASNNVEAGQVAYETMSGTYTGGAPAKCVMTDVTRYAS